ncbi:MAG: DNA repair protein RecN [Flavobacteriales bacterium]|nr:DNA repair protein RecN [Flavobacteriales bacterium]MCB9168201.1 DNA repair protein RecN [Flavobacteriales bacterium]
MLVHLSLKNYLLIESLELDLRAGLTIITGATGSGKSVLIGALGLAMGERGGQVALDPGRRCVIELECTLTGLDHLHAWFEREGVPFEERTILRRQFEPGGRSRAFINDTPVRLEQLRELAMALVHIHSQHHTRLLNDPAFVLELVDHEAGSAALASGQAVSYAEWKVAHADLVRAQEEEERATQELDYLRFQLEELDAADLRPNERTLLQGELARAEHAGEVLEGMRSVEEGLTGEGGLLAILARMRQALYGPAREVPDIRTLVGRLESAGIELKDLADDASRMAEATEIDPEHTRRLRERMDLLLRLEQKHRSDGTDALIVLREELRGRVASLGSLGERITELRRKEEQAGTSMRSSALALSKARKAVIRGLSAKVEEVLHDLGMPGAIFRFAHRTVDPGPTGMDLVHVLFSADPDREPMRLEKVASGGELGRVMLALLGLVADSRRLPTVVFDEIDTGVSGEVADRVGDRMARMAGERQVLAITHLPQIAGKADDHLLVVKDGPSSGTRTHVERLDREARIQALAQMLSGKRTSKAALANARELLKSS